MSAELYRLRLAIRQGSASSGVTKAALLWTASSLDPQWSGLIRQVLGDREYGFDPDNAARPGSVEQTIAFADYAKAIAAH